MQLRCCVFPGWAIGWTALLLLSDSLVCGQEGLVLSEFMAANSGSLLDEDGEPSDWIEVHNAGPATVDLAGWCLTDDPAQLPQWRFPATNLAANAYLVVFASGKARAIPGRPLHTNFQLDRAGEYLALVHPDGRTIAHQFAPSYPPQLDGVSYGREEAGTITAFVGAGADANWLVPTGPADLTAPWTTTNYDAAGWSIGPVGLGFDLRTTNALPPEQVSNVALGRSTTQSSTRDGLGADLGVDGDRANFTHTLAGANLPAWWEVDLGTNASLQSIVLHNRPGYLSRLRDITVQVLDVGGSAINFTSGLLNAENHLGGGLLNQGPEFLTLDLPQLTGAWVSGGRVRVIRQPDPDLSGSGGQGTTSEPDTLCLAEVEVWGGEARLLGPLIRTDLAATMFGRSATLLVRLPFLIAAEEMPWLDRLTLRMHYDDGFVAYLNGVEVARRNAPVALTWDAAATRERSAAEGQVGEDIDLTPWLSLLQEGDNVLAIHGLNGSALDEEFLVAPALTGGAAVSGVERYFAQPSPGAANAGGYLGLVEDTKFSVDRGFYEAPFAVEITTATPGAIIRYTTDGTMPSAVEGEVYTQPLVIDHTTVLRAVATRPGYRPANVDTQTYVFFRDAIAQSMTSAEEAGFPATWRSTPADYEMDPRIAGPEAARVEAALRSLPSVFLSTSLSNLFDPDAGIYANPDRHGEAWERPVSVEMMHTNGQAAFQIDAGLRIQGGWFRPLDRTRKDSFRLLFKGRYGAGKLRHDLFGEPDAVREFDTLVLRAGANDGYAWADAKDTEQFIRDQFGRDLQRAMGHAGPHGRFVHLYLNGLYWGLYNLVERPNEDFSAAYFGGPSEEWDANNAGDTKNGDRQAWDAFVSLAQQPVTSSSLLRLQGLDPQGVRDPALPVYLDLPNYADYMILNIWGGNWDWPNKNFWFGRRRTSDSTGFKFYTWDFENTMGNNRSRSPTNMVAPRAGIEASWVGAPHHFLKGDPEYRLRFADRLQRLFFDNGLLTPEVLIDRYRARADEVELAILAESARWGDDHWQPPQDLADWRRERDWILNTYLPVRSGIVFQQFRTAGLYPAVGAPSMNQLGGAVPEGFLAVLGHTNPVGSIFATLDGSDPRVAGSGLVASTAAAFATPIPITRPTHLRARVLSGGQWSALVEAVFYPPQDLGSLALTEIMYHAPGDGGVDGEEYDFLELQNTGADVLDLSGLVFVSGIDFRFAPGTELAPGAFLVLARNAAAFAVRYPGVPVGGQFLGNLDNGGERLTLAHPLGATVWSVAYGDGAPWPVTADGLGFSLVPVQPGLSAAPDRASRWRASSQPGGSPGAADPPATLPGVIINEILAHTDPPEFDAVELHNPTEMDVDLGGWFLSDDPGFPQKFRLPDGTTLSSGAYLVLDASQFNPLPGSLTSFGLSSTGDGLYLFSAMPDGRLTGYDHGVVFGASFNGVSFGRVMDSAGEEAFPLQTAVTLGTRNAGPRIGPVVISEIHYHPVLGGLEYVELYNLSAAPVPLYDPVVPAHSWHVAGLDYVFPTGITLPPGGVLLLVEGDPGGFRTQYGVPGEVAILGPVPGRLQNEGERLELLAPDTPNTNDVPYVVVETVRYNDRLPWPLDADGLGSSLQRRVLGAYGNDPANWVAGAPTPGWIPSDGDTDGDGLPDSWEIAHGTSMFLPDADADPDGDGLSNGQEFLAGTHPLDSGSRLAITWLGVEAGGVSLEFQAASGRSYRLFYTEALDATWSAVRDVPEVTTNGPVRIGALPVGSAGFYRLVTPASP